MVPKKESKKPKKDHFSCQADESHEKNTLCQDFPLHLPSPPV